MALGYTTRQALPHLIELGRATTLSAPVYLDGTLTAPSAGTVSVYDEGGDVIVSAAAVTVTASVATYTVSGPLTSDLTPSDRWRVEWTLTVSGTTVPIRDEAALVRYRLRPTITDADIGQRIRILSTDLAARPTSATTYSAAIEEADIRVQTDLLREGRRPWLVVSASALRECWLSAAIAVILDGLAIAHASDGDPYAARARDWDERYERAMSRARVAMDWDDDGEADAGGRTGPRAGALWLA